MAVTQRSGSLPYTVVVSAIVFFSFGTIWLLLDQQFVYEIQTLATWASGSTAATAARTYIIQGWQWLPLIILVRIGLDLLVSARIQSTGASLALGSTAVLVVHLFMLVWALVFPSVLDPLFDMALTSDAVAAVGFDTGVQLLYDGAFNFGPGAFLLVIDLWFLSAPIRRDSYGGFA